MGTQVLCLKPVRAVTSAYLLSNSSRCLETSHVLTLNFVTRRKLSCLLKKKLQIKEHNQWQKEMATEAPRQFYKYCCCASDRYTWPSAVLWTRLTMEQQAPRPEVDLRAGKFLAELQGSEYAHTMWWTCELESSWLMYKEVKMPWKNILKGGFKAQKCKITNVRKMITELKQRHPSSRYYWLAANYFTL